MAGKRGGEKTARQEEIGYGNGCDITHPSLGERRKYRGGKREGREEGTPPSLAPPHKILDPPLAVDVSSNSISSRCSINVREK